MIYEAKLPPRAGYVEAVDAKGNHYYRPINEPTEEPTQLDRVEAQATYTAMMTDTLLEV